jgi:hypothetical protein
MLISLAQFIQALDKTERTPARPFICADYEPSLVAAGLDFVQLGKLAAEVGVLLAQAIETFTH